MKTIRLAGWAATFILIGGVAVAQEPQRLAEPVALDIPELPLNDALKQLARQAGFQVVFYSRESEGIRAPKLNGKFTAEAALNELLAGTSLTYEFVNANTVAIRASKPTASAPSEGTLRLAQSGASPADSLQQDDTTQQGRAVPAESRAADNSMLEEITVFGRGTTNTVKDVPQTVNVYGADFIQNIKASVVDDVVRFTPNGRSHGWAVPLYTSVEMRGFATSMTWNGMAYRSTNGTLKLANVERVEVLKGPASVLYGPMEPGAVVNLVTKRPQKQFEASGDIRFGSFNERHYDIDIGGPLSDRVGVRLNAAYFRTDTPFDNTGVRDLFVAPVVEFQLADRTQLTVDAFYDHTNWPNGYTDGRVPVLGGLIPNPLGKIPLSTNLQYDRDITAPQGYGDLHHPQTDVDTNARLSHEFSDDLSMNVALSYHNSKYDREHIFTGSLQPDNRTMSRSYLIDKGYDSTAKIAHADLKWKFRTGALTHETALGADHTDTDYGLLTAFMGVTPIDVFAPVYGTIVLPDPIPFDAEDGGTKVSELFFQDRVSLGRFHLLGGARYSDFESSGHYQVYQGELIETGIKDRIWSSQVGALYDVADWLTLFASRNESFVPRLATIFGRGLTAQPERGIQYEIGAKFGLGNTGLSGNIVYFDIDKKDLLVADVEHPGFAMPLGGVNSKGFEISVEGSPAPGLSIYMGYGHNPTKITEADENVGNSFFGVPRETLSAYVNYKMQGGPLRGLAVMGSMQYLGERWSSDDNTYKWPSYTRVDLGATYSVNEHLDVGLNVRNLLESTVYVGFGGTWVARDPFRTVMGTVTYRY